VTAAPALELLAELRRQGLRLTPDGDQHLRIAPPEKLTPALRQRIVAAKPGLIAALRMQAGLARRVRAMAARWSYSDDDLAYALGDALDHPASWFACCEADELHHELAARAGLSPVSKSIQ